MVREAAARRGLCFMAPGRHLLGPVAAQRDHGMAGAEREHYRERLPAGDSRQSSRRAAAAARNICRVEHVSRGQEIAVQVDEARAVDLVLSAGEFSLHHVGIVHGSIPNESDEPRIGLAVRYISPDVVQQGPERDLAVLARGHDRFGHFELAVPPRRDMPYGTGAVHAKRWPARGAISAEATAVVPAIAFTARGTLRWRDMGA